MKYCTIDLHNWENIAADHSAGQNQVSISLGNVKQRRNEKVRCLLIEKLWSKQEIRKSRSDASCLRQRLYCLHLTVCKYSPVLTKTYFRAQICLLNHPWKHFNYYRWQLGPFWQWCSNDVCFHCFSTSVSSIVNVAEVTEIKNRAHGRRDRRSANTKMDSGHTFPGH